MNWHAARKAGWVGVIVLASTAVTGAAIEVRVATDKPAYFPGEELKILVTATNPSATVVGLTFMTSRQVVYSLDGIYTPNLYYAPVLTGVTIPPYGSYTWTLVHDWGYRLQPGPHTVTGEVVGYGGAGPVAFTVLPSPVVPGDVLFDFDHIPGTDARLGHLLAYEEWGVRFGMYAGSHYGVQTTDGNGWLSSGVCTYPTGFNLFAKLERPVYGATAKITAGLNMSITMLARDSQSNVIASATSAAVTALYQFSEPVSLKTTQPIAILEWWPSDARSLVGIDDLYLEATPSPVDPAVALTVERVAGGVKVAWPEAVANQGLEMTSDLVNGPWETVTPALGTNSLVLPVAPAGEARFVRLRVE
ncbi:MAG TPA: hypothetical protein VJA21_24560 [Verrucomicrobiae bacterium]